MPYSVRRIWNPALYQGGSVRKRYFEGWYFKCVDAAGSRLLAVIPGISYSADGSSRHAFVQVVYPAGASNYFAYPVEEFRFDRTLPFGIQIGPNRFGADGMALDLANDAGSVRGAVGFGEWAPWPVRPLSPGIMGWYRFVPRMECYHGVLSMDHSLSGSLDIDGTRVGFEGGRGYAEKDWGHSFPSSWVWAQTNHFGREGTSLTCSVARIPWMGGAFVGNIVGLLLDGRLHRFATYTGARAVCVDTVPGGAHIIVRDRREEIELRIEGGPAAPLKAPVLGAMETRADEMLGGTVHVTLRALEGGRVRVVYEGSGLHAGVEVMNERDELGRACEEDPTL